MVTKQIAGLEAKLRGGVKIERMSLLGVKTWFVWLDDLRFQPATDPNTPSGAWEWVRLLSPGLDLASFGHPTTKYSVSTITAGGIGTDHPECDDPLLAVAAAVEALANAQEGRDA